MELVYPKWSLTLESRTSATVALLCEHHSFSFLIYWIVVKNTTRNEVGSKLCCGGVVGHLDAQGLVIASTGLRAYAEYGQELYVSYFFSF